MSWRFLLFAGLMALLFYAHFYLAHRQWHSNRGAEANDIDRDFVLREHYFAESFRALASRWKDLPHWTADSLGARTLRKGGETVRATPSLELPAHTRSDDVLLVEGDLHVGADSVLSREAYVTGRANLGRACRVQAVASDGDLTLGEHTRVVRWVDSGGSLVLSPFCTIHSRATARQAVEVHTEASARSIYAPEIRVLPASAPADTAVELAAAREVLQPDNASRLRELGMNPDKLALLAPDCWVYRDNLTLRSAISIGVTLIVKGDCRIAAQSTVAADLKAEGRLYIGEHSHCLANLVAGDSICMGESSRFSGMMHARNDILLGSGVRGGADGKLIGAYAGGWLYVGEDVIIKGKLAAGEEVRAVPAGFAEAWRRDHGFAI